MQKLPNISAFNNTPQAAIDELKLGWELVKEDNREKGQEILIASACQN
jgi:predicted RNase H-like HicB family nuclease